MDKKIKPTVAQQIEAEKDYPGASIDYADDEKVSENSVKADVRNLNNNPRNNNLDE